MREAFERGQRIGKYEILGRLSVGGMAELYLASLDGQGGFRKFIALKRVLPSIAENESFTKMFLDEARITAALSHAAIAQVYELAEDPTSHEPMLAMEFVAGQNLEQIVHRARSRKVTLPIGFICRVAHEMLMALHFAHGFVEPATGHPMPVIHRDINPRNVMVTYTGGTKVVDFGIAKARGRLDQTQVGMVKGTLQYMAPEQVTVQTIDGRTDLYAASMLFYELFAGRHPFDDVPMAATMRRIVDGNLPALAQANGTIPPELAAAVMKGLEVAPTRRWRTGREYARAIDRAFPDPFDDDQMSEFMGGLFADKIAVTRSLLSSSAAEASPADLRLMTMLGDESAPEGLDAPVPLGAPAVRDDPTQMLAAQGVANQMTVKSLEPVAIPPPIVDVTTDKQPVLKRSGQDLPKAPVRRAPSDRHIPAAPRRSTAEVRAGSPVQQRKPEKQSLGLVVVLVLAIASVALLAYLVWGQPGTTDAPQAPTPRGPAR